MLLVELDNENLTDLLIHNGSNVNSLNEEGQTLLHLAVSKGIA